MISRRSLAAYALPIAIAATLAACGGGAATSGPATTSAPASAAAGSPGTSGPVSGSEAPTGDVAVHAKEYAFSPDALTVPAGEVTFVVTNGGSENHEFDIRAGDQSLGRIGPFPRDTTQTLDVTLAAGEYEFVCRLNGHDVLGMKGTLTVTEG